MQNGIYEHLKTGQKYQVIGLALSVDDLGQVVVYQSLYGDYGLWTRKLEDFEQKFTRIADSEFLPKERRQLRDT